VSGDRHNQLMLIVCGHLVLDPPDRDAHVIASTDAVRLARQAPGCLDFAVSADPLDPTRVNVFERWATPEDLDAFRSSGDPDDETADFSRIHRFEIEQYTVERRM
jgi:quinol monooxygenase YgiN